MSHYTAATVSEKMALYDALVRAGLEAGNIQAVMDLHYGQIKTFIADSRGFTKEARAAYEGKYFLHGFLRQYRIHRASPTFQQDMAARLVTWNSRAARSAAASTRPVQTPPTGVAHGNPAAPTSGGDHVGQAMAPVAAARTPPPPTPRSPTAPVHSQHLAPISRPTFDQPTAIAGPGPTTALNAAVAMAARSAEREDSSQHPLGTAARTFAALEEEEEEDEEQYGEQAIRVMEEQMERLGREELSGMDVDEEGPRPVRIKGKGKARESKAGEESESESEWNTEKENMVRARPRARRPSTPAAAKRRERVAHPTGELFDPPCSNCRFASRECEQTSNGGACVDCKLKKKRCEYALPQTRKVKSKPTVESEDDRERSAAHRDAEEPGPEAAPVTPADGRGRSRAPAAAAKPHVNHAQIRRSAARAQTQAKRAAAKKEAMEAKQAAMEARKAAKAHEVKDHAGSDRAIKQVPRRPRRATAPPKSQRRSAEEFVGRVADRLERVTENAERALALPREEGLQTQMRRCEDYITRMSDVVLSLCALNGVAPVGLVTAPFRAVGTLPPPRVSRGVGTDDSGEPGAIEPPAVTARPPSPPAPTAAARSQSPVAAALPPSISSTVAVAPVEPQVAAGSTIPSSPAPAPSPLPPPPSPSPPPSPAHSGVCTDVDMAAAPHMAGAITKTPPTTAPVNEGPSTVSLPTLSSVPPLNLIGATPDNSQEARADGPIPVPATPPQIPSVFGPPMAPLDLEGMPGSQGANTTSQAVAINPPRRRGRSRTPNPMLLDLPAAEGIQTRSRTRSPSLTAVGGEKRKLDDKSDAEAVSKRRKT